MAECSLVLPTGARTSLGVGGQPGVVQRALEERREPLGVNLCLLRDHPSAEIGSNDKGTDHDHAHEARTELPNDAE